MVGDKYRTAPCNPEPSTSSPKVTGHEMETMPLAIGLDKVYSDPAVWNIDSGL